MEENVVYRCNSCEHKEQIAEPKGNVFNIVMTNKCPKCGEEMIRIERHYLEKVVDFVLELTEMKNKP